MRRVVTLALLPMVCLAAAVAHAQAPAKTPAQAPAKQQPAFELKSSQRKPWTGDLDGMIKRRMIRVLVPYSKTYYFVDRAVQRGISYDVTRLLEARSSGPGTFACPSPASR